MYYNRRGNPISTDEWIEKIQDPDYKIVRQTWFDEQGNCYPDGPKQEYLISTVWLGLDHGYNSENLPIIFETLVQLPGQGDEEMYRYTNEAEAVANHNRLVSHYLESREGHLPRVVRFNKPPELEWKWGDDEG